MQTTETSHDILEAATLLVTARVLSHSGQAVLSGRSGGNRFVVTATAVIRELTPDQLAIAGLDGGVVEGELDPENADIAAMHSVVYRARPDVGGIIHTHSPAATAFALAHQPLPCRTEQLLRSGQAEAVPVVPWGPLGSDVPVRGIAEVLADWPTTNAVLLANHGLLAFGADPLAAAHLIIAVEDSAQAELAAARIGGGIDFPPGALQAVRESMAKARRSHSPVLAGRCPARYSTSTAAPSTCASAPDDMSAMQSLPHPTGAAFSIEHTARPSYHPPSLLLTHCFAATPGTKVPSAGPASPSGWSCSTTTTDRQPWAGRCRSLWLLGPARSIRSGLNGPDAVGTCRLREHAPSHPAAGPGRYRPATAGRGPQRGS